MSTHFIRQGSRSPAITLELRNAMGELADVTGEFLLEFTMRLVATGTIVTGTATVDSTTSVATYSWADGDTDIAGGAYGMFTLTKGEESFNYPEDGFVDIQILPSLSVATFTPVANFRAPMRMLLGDSDLDIPEYEDDQLDEAVKVAVRLGKAGSDTVFAIQSGCVVPAIDPEQGATAAIAYAKVLYWAIRYLTASKSDYRISTRAFSDAMKAPRELVELVIQEINQLENGEMSS